VFDIGPGEFIALAIVALIVFGPDRLPKLAADAGRFIRQVRVFVAGAKRDLRDELGPEFADLDLRDLNPRHFVRRTLLEDADLHADDFRVDLNEPLPQRPRRSLEPGEPAPYDPDTT
jgi:sec-independent protein translocase protein TatB